MIILNISNENDETWISEAQGGVPLSVEDAKELIKDLENYILLGETRINAARRERFDKMFPPYPPPPTPKRPKPAPKPAPGYIYLIVNDREQYKIGYSKTPAKRIEVLNVKLPWPIEVLHLIPTNHMRLAEQHLHKHYAEKNARGEWYWLSESDIADITNLKQIVIEGIDLILPEAK